MDRQEELKIAAITAAVMHHNALAQAAIEEAPATVPVTQPVWGMAGRQDNMMMRTLWQRRLGKSW